VSFSEIDDKSHQAHAWCERINARVHRTTHERPLERRKQEPLSPLPQAFAWERFATEERRVGWDGYLSYDGGVTGLPSTPPLAGSVVQVRERHGVLSIWSAGQLVVEYTKRPQSQLAVTHPDQFRERWSQLPPGMQRSCRLSHLRPAPLITKRDLAEYDHLYGVEVVPCNH
jgi:hypothetical protein